MAELDTLWVRHGESTWNRAGLMQGQMFWPPLTSLGVRQARAVADELVRYRPRRVVSSDLLRALETARIVGDRLYLSVDQSPLLRERCWGQFESRPTADGHRADSELSATDALPLGESRDDVAQRLRRLVPQLISGQSPVVVVTHGDVIREATRLWAPCGDRARSPENGCIVRIASAFMVRNG